MKANYLSPEVGILDIQTLAVLCSSGRVNGLKPITDEDVYDETDNWTL